MRFYFRGASSVLLLSLLAVLPLRSALAAGAQEPACGRADAACREFARLMAADQYDAVIGKIDPKAAYSAEARTYIGQAYLMIAGREGNAPEDEERYCRKALEYGATSAYMGLYFIHAEKDPEQALGYLRQYIATRPKDSVPYVILGESELAKRNYTQARSYFSEARTVAHGRSANLDWLMFEACYLTGDYTTASTMLDSALAQGMPAGDLRSLVATDQRFSDMAKKSEFRKFLPLLKGDAVPSPSRS